MTDVGEHWRRLAAFARAEIATGGPDPHMRLSAEMARGQLLDEMLWRGGCYVAVYSAPFAEVLWRAWPWAAAARDATQADFYAWCVAHWSQLRVHRHRKTVLRPDWMADYLYSYARFAELLYALGGFGSNSPEYRYDYLWDKALSVRRLGRYVALKLLEYFREVGVTDVALHDLRARDGWSPRAALAMLWPEHARVAEKSNAPELLALTDELGARSLTRLRDEHGLTLSWFQLQVFLCEYKQASRGKQHPGRATDTELRLGRLAAELWPDAPTDLWRARRALVPEWALGELQGWPGNRDALKTVMRDHGYAWSDAVYDWHATADLSAPARRPAPLADGLS